MTTAQGGGKPLGQFKQLMRWASHYTHWFLLFALCCSIASSFTHGPLTWIFLPLGLLWIVASWGDYVHIRHWDCPKCVERAPIFDGQERAAKRINALRLLHEKKWLIWGFVVGYASLIGLPFLVTTMPWQPFTVIPWYMVWAVVAWAGTQHRDLQRWCPWCRDERGGDGPVEVVPPTPVAENVR